MRPDGLIPHTVFWHSPARWRRAPFYATLSYFRNLGTAHTQTPVIGLAWEIVADGDPDFAAEGARAAAAPPRLAPARAGPRRRRADLDHPPRRVRARRFAQVRPRVGPPGAPPARLLLAGRALPPARVLVARDPRALLRARRGRSRERLLRAVAPGVVAAGRRRGVRPAGGAHRTGAARALLRRAQRTLLRRRILRRATDRGLHLVVAGAARPRGDPGGRPPPPGRGAPTRPAPLRRRVGIPSVSMEEPSFRAGFDRWRCWRGPSWVNSAWLLVPQLRELGYEREADRIVRSLAAAVERMASASTTTRTRAPGSPPATSAGRRSSWTCSTKADLALAA